MIVQCVDEIERVTFSETELSLYSALFRLRKLRVSLCIGISC